MPEPKQTRYRAYPAYKPSGVEWSKEFPDDWEKTRFKNLFTIKKRIAGKIGPDVLSITQNGIKVKDLDSGDGQLASDYSKYQHVYAGDFAMNHMDLLTGYVDISRFDGVTSPDYRVFSLDREDCHPAYYLYILQHCYHAKIFFPLGQGAAHLGRWRLPAEAFNTFVAPVPALPEQTHIAAFLDYETAKIDALIAKQQRLIALLEEKRQAVISHVVTKGLNPDAPMRPSGIDWLGDVPAHWDLVRLLAVSEVVDPNPSHRNPEYVDDGFPFISTQEFFGRDQLIIDTPRRVSEKTVIEQETRCNFQFGSIVFSRKGTIGATRVLPAGVRLGILDSLCVINPKQGIMPKFLAYILTSYFVAAQYGPIVNGAALPQLSVGKVRSLKLLLPPDNEQRSVVCYLDEALERHDALIDKAQSAITLLKERRTALISAAVTGKIDVRDWTTKDKAA